METVQISKRKVESAVVSFSKQKNIYYVHISTYFFIFINSSSFRLCEIKTRRSYRTFHDVTHLKFN